jgi:hypothetical protein
MPSSAVQSIGYELEHSRLTVVFTSGRTYQYYVVPVHVAQEFKAASSKGTFFNTRIRDRYHYREVTPDMAKAD